MALVVTSPTVRRYSPLGNKLRAARKRVGISQEALARELGTHRRTVIAWEGGENAPSPAYARKLEQFFGAEPGEFTEDDEITALETRLVELYRKRLVA